MRALQGPMIGVRVVEACPVCSSTRIEYEFTVSDRLVASCIDCTMLFLREPANSLSSAPDFASRVRSCVAAFRRDVSPSTKRTLVLVPSGQSVAIDGCDVLSVREFLETSAKAARYDRVVCVDALDRLQEVEPLLSRLHSIVASDAVLSFTQRSARGTAARYSGANWSGFRSGASLFFDVDTLQSLLIRYGFRHPRIYFDGRWKRGSLRVRLAGALFSLVRLAGPATFVQRRLSLIDDSITLVCGRGEPIERHRLSVIVPVYNEIATFDSMMEQLASKQIDEVDIEIILVESNSTDGSRDRVLKYSDHPRVTVILQERPRGKGNAVRAGLQHASGDIVLFQDADLEYELADYDDLVRPIRLNRRNFVIGSRHRRTERSWKIREFNGAPVLSQIFNVGHVVFLLLLNGIYGQRLADPFSMFKVFRRDCLAGLDFECDRFDFDFEIVIKLLRKGYRPEEIPVNYHARSIAEGKKVTMIRDPLTWIRALLRFRSSALYAKNHVS